MNKAIFREIQRILWSLNRSTNVNFVFRREGVRISGRCSPYISHKEMAWLSGHYIDELIYIANNRFAVLVDSKFRFDVGDAPTDEIRWERIPAFLIRVLIPEWYRPDWIYTDTVRVIYPNRFAGFTEDGKPIYRDEVKQTLRGECVKKEFEIYGYFKRD